jgi:hypothetical protein
VKNLFKIIAAVTLCSAGLVNAQEVTYKPYIQTEYYTMENRVTGANSEMIMMAAGVSASDGWDYALALGPHQTKLGQEGSQLTFVEARVRKTFSAIPGTNIKPYVFGLVGDKMTSTTNAWHYLVDAGLIVPLNANFTGVVGGWYRNAFDTSDKMYQTRWSTSLIYHATKADSVQLQFAQSEGDSSLNQWRLSYKHSF